MDSLLSSNPSLSIGSQATLPAPVLQSLPASPLRVGVVGIGHMGKNHVRVYGKLSEKQNACALTAVYDVSTQAAQAVVDELENGRKGGEKNGGSVFHGLMRGKEITSVRVTNSLEEFVQLVDAVTVCTPTVTHYAIGKFLLERGKHLLIEKPIAQTVEEAYLLQQLAHEQGCVLQVGHIERFNPVLTALEAKLQNPRFLEVTRLSPYSHRSTDIGVVLDLMIHDLEIVLHLVRSPICSIDPVGVAILNEREDIANVRLRFENGCVANVVASRVSQERMRKIRVFQGHAGSSSYLSLDYIQQEGFLYQVKDKGIVSAAIEVEKGDALEHQLASFLGCASQGLQPKVSGREAAAALDLALEITRRIEHEAPEKPDFGNSRDRD